MTVTAKTTTTTTTRQSDKKFKYKFISLLTNNNSSVSLLSSSSSMDTSISETKKKKSTNNSNSKYKLFKPWNQPQDSEYKSLGKALEKFQSKDRHKVETLKSVVIPWLKKHTTVNTSDKGLQYGRVIFLKWWNLLITFLPEAAYTDRTLYFECILMLMARNEFEDLDLIGPIPQSATTTHMNIPIETIFAYRAALMNTLNYAIDRLNQKGVYSNVISFCARVLAICFFKIPGVGLALLQALPVSKPHIKRILNETIGDEDESSNIELIKTQNDEIVSLFPSHLKILCYVNIKTWWHQLEDAKRIRGEPPIEMNGNWIRRWKSDDSELFFSFYKHYHIVLKTYLNISNSVAFKSITPPLKYIIAPGYIHLATFFLLKIESLIHRNIHTITTVIQFEQPRGNNGNNSNGISLDAADIGIGSLPATNIRVGGDKNNNNSRKKGDIEADGSDYHGNDGNSNLSLGNTMEIGASAIDSNSSKPKALDMANKRFVETMVAIVENGYFQEMCNVWVKAVVRKTNMYDAESVFCLLDFIDTLIVELDTRDSVVMSMGLSSTSSVSSSNSSNDSNTALFSPPNLTNIIDVSFYISLVQILLKNSDHTITILRTISFIYTHFTLLTSQPCHLKYLVKDTLLNEQTFEQMFCHWSRNIRIYYMRLLVWRVGRMAGSVSSDDDKPLGYINNGGGNNDNFIGENGYVIIDMLTTLQNRLENLQICFEFISNYSGEMKDLQNVIQAKIEENIQEIKNYNKVNQIKPYVHQQISSPISKSSNKNHHINNNGNKKKSLTATTIIQWMLKNNQQKFTDSVTSITSSSSSSSPTSSTSPTSPTSPSSSSTIANISTSFLVKTMDSSSQIESLSQTSPSQQQQRHQHHHNSSSTSSSSSSLTTAEQIKQLKLLLWHYSINVHVYASKAIPEYEAVNQDYAEWCGQITNPDDNNSNNNNIGNGSDYDINDDSNWIETRFPKLTVEYPKYFGNGLVNTMF